MMRCGIVDWPRDGARAATHGSLIGDLGRANVKVVQRLLGHASVAMTLDVYADLFDDDLTGVADRLDETVGKVSAERSADTA